MSIVQIKPCSELDGRVIVKYSFPFPIDTEAASRKINKSKMFSSTTYLKSSGVIWLRLFEKSIMVTKKGTIIVNRAESLQDAEAILATLRKLCDKKGFSEEINMRTGRKSLPEVE